MNIFERIRASEKIQAWSLGESQISALQTLTMLKTQVRQWGTFQVRTFNRSLLSTMLTIGGLTMLVKLVAAGKETFIARQLGVGDALDAFLVAYSLPALATSIIAGSFNSALIPTYMQVREQEGNQAAHRLFAGVMFWSLGLLLLISALLALLFPLVLPYLASGFSPEKLVFTRGLFSAVLPIVAVTGVSITWTAVLNAEGEFALPAITPIVTSLVVTAVLLFRVQTWGVWGLAVGTSVGACLEAALIGIRLRGRGISPLPKWRSMDATLRQVMRQYLPLAASGLVFSGTSLADQAIAATLGAGKVATLNYGYKIIALIISITSTAVIISVLPHFSRLAATGDWKGLRRDLNSYTSLILFALVPTALLLSYFSVPLVRLVFERGAFTAHDTRLVGHVQAWFAMQLPFYTLGLMYTRLISALKHNDSIFIVSFISVSLNLALDIIFARYLGVAGIALSTAVVSVAFCGTMYMLLLRALPATAKV
jgi:putative peptidoglycan lipid II flippase